jgi:copper homeostasis protein CutC
MQIYRISFSAVQGGADRLELCANLGAGGGTTPSLGLLKMVKQAVKDIPIMVGPLTRPLSSSGSLSIGDDPAKGWRFFVL